MGNVSQNSGSEFFQFIQGGVKAIARRVVGGSYAVHWHHEGQNFVMEFRAPDEDSGKLSPLDWNRVRRRNMEVPDGTYVFRSRDQNVAVLTISRTPGAMPPNQPRVRSPKPSKEGARARSHDEVAVPPSPALQASPVSNPEAAKKTGDEPGLGFEAAFKGSVWITGLLAELGVLREGGVLKGATFLPAFAEALEQGEPAALKALTALGLPSLTLEWPKKAGVAQRK